MKHFYMLPYTILLSTGEHLVSGSKDNFRLIYVLSGLASLTDGRNTRTLTTGDMVLVGPETAAGMHICANNAARTMFAVITIDSLYLSAFNQFRLPQIRQATPLNSYMHINVRSDNPDTGDGPQADRSHIPLGQAVIRLINSYYQPAPGMKALTEAILPVCQNLVSFLAETSSKHVAPDTLPPRAMEIMHYLHSNYTQPLTLQDTAAHFGLTPPYLSAYITDKIGVSFNKYLTQLRISAAQRYLVHTDLTCTQIMGVTGFANSSAFNSAFKKACGKTPNEYRKSMIGKPMTGSSSTDAAVSGYEEKAPGALIFSDNKKYGTSLRLYESDDYPKNQRLEYQKEICVHIEEGFEHRSPMPLFQMDVMQFFATRSLLPVPMYTQLEYAKNTLGFCYIRINRLFYSDVITRDDSGHLNFSVVDSIMNTFEHMQLTPFIIINLTRLKDMKINPDIYDQFTEYLNHCITEYGLEHIRRWKFDIGDPVFLEKDFEQIENQLSEYAEISAKIITYVKKMAPEIRIGGPYMVGDTDTRNLEFILRHWKAMGICPDFTGALLTPYIIDRKKHGSEIISSDSSLMERRLTAVTGYVRHVYGYDLPVNVEINYNFHSDNYLNDSIFNACSMVHHVLKLKSRVQSFILPMHTDFMPETPKPSDRFLLGTNGLMTWHGIPKPIFFALSFLHSLGQSIISEQDGAIVTAGNDGRITILLYNYCRPDQIYYTHTELARQPENVSAFFENRPPKSFDLRLTDLPAARYFTEEFTLTREHGSILDMWLKSGNTPALPRSAVAHLKSYIHPDYRFYTVTARPQLVITAKLMANELKLIQMQPEGR